MGEHFTAPTSTPASSAFTARIELLSDLNQIITSRMSTAKTFGALARAIAFRIGAPCSLGYLLNNESKCLQLQSCFGLPAEVVPSDIALRDSFFSRALSVGGITTISDIQLADREELTFLPLVGLRSIHCVPLQSDHEIFGLLVLGYRDAHPLSAEEMTLLEDFAQGAAAALTHATTQELLAVHAHHLEALVSERTIEANIERAKAEEANLAKSQFVASMSHELRTPLTAVVAYASLLADGLLGAVSPKQHESLASLVRASEHLKQLIDDVLSIARIEAGKNDPTPTDIELPVFLSALHKILLQTAKEKGLTLKTPSLEPGAEHASFSADNRHARQIVLNIMGNAIKYTPRGGTVSTRAEVQGDKVLIHISDTGVGISAQDLHSLFQAYERGTETYATSQQGTGIGLTIARHLAMLNGGTLSVVSTPGEGSTFTIALPLSTKHDSEAVTTSHDMSPENLPRLDGLRILVVDDHNVTRDILTLLISESGGESLSARSIADARAILEKDVPDVVLLDLAFPGENGVDLLLHMRNNTTLASVPTIVVSACPLEADRDRALTAGAIAFLTKPFFPRDVLELLRRVTTSHALEDAS